MDPKHCDPLFTLKISAACSKGKKKPPPNECWLVGLVQSGNNQQDVEATFGPVQGDAGLKTPMICLFRVIIHVYFMLQMTTPDQM